MKRQIVYVTKKFATIHSVDDERCLLRVFTEYPYLMEIGVRRWWTCSTDAKELTNEVNNINAKNGLFDFFYSIPLVDEMEEESYPAKIEYEYDDNLNAEERTYKLISADDNWTIGEYEHKCLDEYQKRKNKLFKLHNSGLA